MIEQSQESPQRAFIVRSDLNRPLRPTRRCYVVTSFLCFLREVQRRREGSLGEVLPLLIQPLFEFTAPGHMESVE